MLTIESQGNNAMVCSTSSSKCLRRAILAAALAAGAVHGPAAAAPGDAAPGALTIRRHMGREWAEEKHPIPRAAASVFTYEGAPRHVRVSGGKIAADYGVSGVVFDAATGEMIRRYTAVDGWPERRPDVFGPTPPRPRRAAVVDPGVIAWRPPGADRTPGRRPQKPPLYVASQAQFAGRTFRALQPALHEILSGSEWEDRRKKWGRWNALLEASAKRSCVYSIGSDGTARRYTTVDGLAGNIVSRLVVADGALWAACVDIYDEERQAWGPGGLCRYDPHTGHWVQVGSVNGRAVRWITLLEAHGEALWVGFRQGEGLTGGKIVYGMGLYPGLYRPKATLIVLARRTGGKWTSWFRQPRKDRSHQDPRTGKTLPTPPTEAPRELALLGERALLYSTVRSRRISGNFHLPMDGQISSLYLPGGTWRQWDADDDLAVRRLTGMHVEDGQAILLGETAALQWVADHASWRRLRTHCTLANPAIQAVTRIGDEVWVGYTSEGYSRRGTQGISRYHTRTGRWTFLSSDDLGTSSPVRSIVADAEGGAWVLFGQPMWREAAAAEPILPFPRLPARTGLGCFAEGRWQFPAELGGVPSSVDRSRRGPNGVERWKQHVPIEGVAAAGGKVFVANLLGVYAGPGKWRRIYDQEPVSIRASDNGRTLAIVRYDSKRSGTEETKYDIGRYDPKTGKLTFRPVKRGELDLYYRWRAARFLREDKFPSGAAPLPARKPGTWYLHPLHTQGSLRVVEMKDAFWIATPGQLIRLDRAKLPAWIGR